MTSRNLGLYNIEPRLPQCILAFSAELCSLLLNGCWSSLLLWCSGGNLPLRANTLRTCARFQLPDRSALA